MVVIRAVVFVVVIVVKCHCGGGGACDVGNGLWFISFDCCLPLLLLCVGCHCPDF